MVQADARAARALLESWSGRGDGRARIEPSRGLSFAESGAVVAHPERGLAPVLAPVHHSEKAHVAPTRKDNAMATKKKKKKHGAASDRARQLWAQGLRSMTEIGRRAGLSAQGARNAIHARSRIGSKTLMRKEALTPKKQLAVHVRASKKAA